MIVVEHKQTGGRFRYPSHNINEETEEGFTITQYVPPEFKLSDNQDPSDIPDFHAVFQENVRYPSQPKDPLNQTDWRDKI